MYTFDVLVWEDPLEDRTMGYGAWCSYVVGVSGQGDTEEEALADIVSAMTRRDPAPLGRREIPGG